MYFPQFSGLQQFTHPDYVAFYNKDGKSREREREANEVHNDEGRKEEIEVG